MKDSSSDQRRLEFPPTCHPTTVALYEYWLETCGYRRMPMRSNIDPTNIPRRVLPGISIVEVVHDDRRYVYRLVGTGEVDVRGNDPTGKSVLEGFFGPSAEDALACYDRVVATQAPLLDPMPFTAPSGKCFLNGFANVRATYRPRVLAIVEQLLEMARQ